MTLIAWGMSRGTRLLPFAPGEKGLPCPQGTFCVSLFPAVRVRPGVGGAGSVEDTRLFNTPAALLNLSQSHCEPLRTSPGGGRGLAEPRVTGPAPSFSPPPSPTGWQPHPHPSLLL